MTRQNIIDHVSRQIQETNMILKAKTHTPAGKSYPTRTMFVKIKKYIGNHLEKSQGDHPRWVVIPGLRGVGKSTLLAQSYSQLLKNRHQRKEIEFIYFTLDEVVNSFGSTLKEVLSVYEQISTINLATHSKPIFIFLDEVHYDHGWASIIKVIQDKNPNIFVLATGSSAISLRTNADEQRRLSIEPLYPMSFAEYAVVTLGQYPPKDLKRKITEALFYSENGTTAYARLKGLEEEVNNYWSKIPTGSMNKYLTIGSIPFTNNYQEENNALDAVYQTIKAIVENDLLKIGNFKKETSPTILQILLILASSNIVSLRKLSSNLGKNTSTVTEILEALVKAEMLIKITPDGSIKTKINKPSKYLFMSPTLRASILNLIGGKTLIEQSYGQLLEDTIGMYLYKEFIVKGSLPVSYINEANEAQADFIIGLGSRKIPLEIGYGKKDTRQVWKTIEKYDSPYGIIGHNGTLDIVSEKGLKVPLKFLLLI